MTSTAWSTTPSNLAGASNVYDFVVAVTQNSINNNLTKLFNKGLVSSQGISEYYAYDINNNLVAISLSDLLAQSNNVNPFDVPTGTALTDSRIRSLFDAGFSFAIQAQIGIPAVASGVTLPGWVDLSNDTSSQVIFNMMCSTFSVCEMTYGPRGAASWINYIQTPAQPVIFQATVNLDFTSGPINTTSPVYTNLPANVQSMIMNTGVDAFSLQQLLFDLTTPGLMSTFDLPGFDTSSDTYTLIKSKFVTFYFDQMKAAGTPLLGVTVACNTSPSWSLQPTSINFEVNAYLDSDNTTVSTDPNAAGLATLDYLCLVGGKKQPSPDHFKWNWIPEAEEAKYDGVLSINRDSFAAYLQNALLPYAMLNCFAFNVKVGVDSGSVATYSFSMTNGQTPSITISKGGSDGVTALSFDYTSPSAGSSDQAGLNGNIGKMSFTQTYHMGVQFIGNTIVVTQTQVVHTSISKNLSTASGDVVNRKKVETFTLSVVSGGQLSAATPITQDTNSDMDPSVNPFVNFFINIKDTINQVDSSVRTFASSNLQNVDLSVVQNYVLPGGNTFSFSSVAFSPSPGLDLVAKINYN